MNDVTSLPDKTSCDDILSRGNSICYQLQIILLLGNYLDFLYIYISKADDGFDPDIER